MAIESIADVSAGEITLHFKLSHVDSVKSKCVMVNDGVVPGRSGAVVFKVGALHVEVVRKPAGKVIDTLPQAVGSLGALLAVCRYSGAVTTSGNFSSRNGYIQEKPMKELNTRKRSGNVAALLVYVIGTAGTSTSWQMRTKDLVSSGTSFHSSWGLRFWLNAKWWIGSIRPKANSAGIGLPF
jgi:hypothetical protein